MDIEILVTNQQRNKTAMKRLLIPVREALINVKAVRIKMESLILALTKIKLRGSYA